MGLSENLFLLDDGQDQSELDQLKNYEEQIGPATDSATPRNSENTFKGTDGNPNSSRKKRKKTLAVHQHFDEFEN